MSKTTSTKWFSMTALLIIAILATTIIAIPSCHGGINTENQVNIVTDMKPQMKIFSKDYKVPLYFSLSELPITTTDYTINDLSFKGVLCSESQQQRLILTAFDQNDGKKSYEFSTTFKKIGTGDNTLCQLTNYPLTLTEQPPFAFIKLSLEVYLTHTSIANAVKVQATLKGGQEVYEMEEKEYKASPVLSKLSETAVYTTIPMVSPTQRRIAMSVTLELAITTPTTIYISSDSVNEMQPEGAFEFDTTTPQYLNKCLGDIYIAGAKNHWRDSVDVVIPTVPGTEQKKGVVGFKIPDVGHLVSGVRIYIDCSRSNLVLNSLSTDSPNYKKAISYGVTLDLPVDETFIDENVRPLSFAKSQPLYRTVTESWDFGSLVDSPPSQYSSTLKIAHDLLPVYQEQDYSRELRWNFLFTFQGVTLNETSLAHVIEFYDHYNTFSAKGTCMSQVSLIPYDPKTMKIPVDRQMLSLNQQINGYDLSTNDVKKYILQPTPCLVSADTPIEIVSRSVTFDIAVNEFDTSKPINYHLEAWVETTQTPAPQHFKMAKPFEIEQAKPLTSLPMQFKYLNITNKDYPANVTKYMKGFEISLPKLTMVPYTVELISNATTVASRIFKETNQKEIFVKLSNSTLECNVYDMNDRTKILTTFNAVISPKAQSVKFELDNSIGGIGASVTIACPGIAVNAVSYLGRLPLTYELTSLSVFPRTKSSTILPAIINGNDDNDDEDGGHKKKPKSKLPIVIGIIAAILVLGAIGAFVFLKMKNNKNYEHDILLSANDHNYSNLH